MPGRDAREATKESTGWEGLKGQLQSSWRAGWALYPQENTGSFLHVLTTEKPSRQMKGSVRFELQRKILGGPEENRRKHEPGKREYMSIELMWAKLRSENKPQLMNCAQVVEQDQHLWLEFSTCASICLHTFKSYLFTHPLTQLRICPFCYQPPQLNHHSFIYPFIYPSNHSFKYPSILYPVVQSSVYLPPTHSSTHQMFSHSQIVSLKKISKHTQHTTHSATSLPN